MSINFEIPIILLQLYMSPLNSLMQLIFIKNFSPVTVFVFFVLGLHMTVLRASSCLGALRLLLAVSEG